MSQPGGDDKEMRDIWGDYNRRQEFEHDLLNRKTTWMLATQAILFAAYGLTVGSGSTDGGLDRFRKVVAGSGLSIALITLVGVVFIIRSKYLSWTAYRKFFKESGAPKLPRPLDREALQWGVNDRNTWLTLLPEALFPIVFIVGWCLLLVLGT
jgi:hypothetical protein